MVESGRFTEDGGQGLNRIPGGRFIWSLAGLGLLPMLPEIVLFFQSHADFKAYKTIWYFEFVVSFLLLAPVLILPRVLSRVWVVVVTLLVGPATILVGYYSAAHGARWNLTAHTALLETNRAEAWGYARTFFSPGIAAWVGFLGAAFAVCLIAHLKSPRPPRRTAWAVVATGLLLSAYGIRLVSLYATKPFRVVTPEAVRIFGTGYLTMHPLTDVAGIHYNYVSSHRYYLSHYRQAEAHFRELEGATTLPGAVSPRVGVVVVGESANRRHWSLYGYGRQTTPRMQELSPELFLFRDVISNSVGTVSSVGGMLTTPRESVPVFHLFTGAGYRTHWISSRADNGEETQLAGLVESCDDKAYLSGAYDEALIPFLSRALTLPGKQMIFLNLTGSHVRYSDDYPVSQAVFSGPGAIPQFIATYDNSIHYTDYVLWQIIAMLKQRNEASFMLYFSDHGEDVYDSRPDRYLFRDPALANDPMVEVPFVLWLSPGYAAENREFVSRDVAGAIRKPFQNVELYHSLIGLMRLTHPLYDSSKDLFSPGFVERERLVGSPEHVYHGSGAF